MHIGRSHHLDVIVSIVGGFAASFLSFFVTTYTGGSHSLGGQLLAGDPTINRQFPSTLNTMHAALDGSDPIANALTSYTWWTAVVIGGIVASFVVFKLIRRYV